VFWIWVVLGGLLAFYLLAPVWSVINSRPWQEQGYWGDHTRWQRFLNRIRRTIHSWYIWPFHQTGSWRTRDGRGYYKKPDEECTWVRGDWGPWYRATFRWWWAKYQVWRNPPKCHFCDAKALGVYAHGMYPVSIGVCATHVHKLSEDFANVYGGKTKWEYYAELGARESSSDGEKSAN
jgi:hypothetical protein